MKPTAGVRARTDSQERIALASLQLAINVLKDRCEHLHARTACASHDCLDIASTMIASSSLITEVFTIFGIVSSTLDLATLVTTVNDEYSALETRASTVDDDATT